MSVSLLPPRSRLTPEVADLLAALDRVREAGASGDPLVLKALAQQQAVLDGLVLREVAAVEQLGSAQELGLRSTGALLQAATGCSGLEAAGTVRLAGRLSSDLAPVGQLLLTGRLTRRHATAVLHGLRGLDVEQISQVLPAVCAAAVVMDPVTLTTVLREHTEAISPALAEAARRSLTERLGVSLSELPDGSGHLRGALSAEGRGRLQAYLDAKTRGERTAGDPRSAARRRHDALLELVDHGLDCTGIDVPTQGGGRAQLTILASAGAVLALPGAAPATVSGACHGLLTRAELLRLLCDADLQTLFLTGTGTGTGSMERLELGRTVRTVSRAQWKALDARDRACVVRSCHRPPASCQAHHIQHWADGGSSDLHNLVLLCHHHHRQLHDQHAVLAHSDGRAFGPTGWTDPPPPPWTQESSP